MNERIEELAEHLERYATFGRGDRSHEAAGLLREQHAEIERLREAVKAEREECAKTCEGMARAISASMAAYTATTCAAAIRARGET